MPTALHYTSTKPPTGREREVFGLQVAISDLLKAWFRHGSTEKFPILIGNEQELQEINTLAAEANLDPARLSILDRRFPDQNLPQFSTIFRAEPDTRNLLWQRQLTGNYAFCGLAHAISGTEAGDVLQEYILAPSQAADTLICPSHAVKSAIQSFWTTYADYLAARFGARYQCPVQLPVIPLGIDLEKFATRITPDKRAAQRAQLNIAETDITLLWVGRLSAAIKAHPLAMFQAAERAAILTGAKIHLVMMGYFIPQEAEPQFQKLASDICKKARVTFIAANDPRFPDGIWAAGDIFLSLIDNMQESFGLTPIEAMAAGLPRVISDWDGYRDSITDGEDGFLIRTTQPPPGMGLDLAAQILSTRETYGGFLAKTALTVAVDTEQAAARIAQLVTDKNLRATMAAKARTRAQSTYDWRHIIPAYENIWADQAARRTSSKTHFPSALPQLPDPYTMYATYPTSPLALSDKITLAATLDQIKLLWSHDINIYANDTMIPPTDIPALLGWLGEQGETPISALFTKFSHLDPARLWRTIAWLQKLGILANSSWLKG